MWEVEIVLPQRNLVLCQQLQIPPKDNAALFYKTVVCEQSGQSDEINVTVCLGTCMLTLMLQLEV